jgi:Mg2+ and Co2+ transporter CorA
MLAQPHNRRQALGAILLIVALIVSIYVIAVIVNEGIDSAVVTVALAALFLVSLARLWVWSKDRF